jgi:putative hemolysin
MAIPKMAGRRMRPACYFSIVWPERILTVKTYLRLNRYPAIFALLAGLVISACQPNTPQGQGISQTERSEITPTTSLPNPASVFCEEKGYKLEIHTTADGSQSGVCVFPDSSECDEWAFYRGECEPANQINSTPIPTSEATLSPAAIPTPLPIDPVDYQGWWTYTHASYHFTMMLPEDWIVKEITTSDPLMNGHLLSLHPKNEAEKESIRMTFRRPEEDALLWPTGVGQGEFILNGTLEMAGQPAQRVLLVCPGGEITSIWYHQGEGRPNIARSDLEFGFIFSAGSHCEAGYSLGGKVQRVGEMIIASLQVP